jgi:3-carboxy-cis,cis-muconate cycloisomerase
MTLYSNYFNSSGGDYLENDATIIRYMLEVEAALAKAQAKNNIIPEKDAETIASCCSIEYYDITKIKSELPLGGNAAIPLVKQLIRNVKNVQFDASKYVHLGATSQDIVDTAHTLLIRDFMNDLEAKLITLCDLLDQLARSHRQTFMIGRTLLQQARPITFGVKTARWMAPILSVVQRYQESKHRILSITLGGAVGCGNEFLTPEVQADLATDLQLTIPNHQSNFLEASTILASLIGHLGKMAKDISLLMQTEVGEVYEGALKGKGGSSTMPHKRNPVTCASLIANSVRAPHLLATLYSAIPQEHERSAGLWHAEWEVIIDLMRLCNGSITNAIDLITNLEVDVERMKQNLELTNGLIYAEKVTLVLAEKIGRQSAHENIEKACRQSINNQVHLKEIISNDYPDIENVEALFLPENSIGDSLRITDQISENWKEIKNQILNKKQ